MSNHRTPTAPEAPGAGHGFEIARRRRWPWVAGAALVVVGVAAAIAVPLLSPATSANEGDGATLYVGTAEGNSAEQALVQFIAEEVAPSTASRSSSRASPTATPSTGPCTRARWRAPSTSTSCGWRRCSRPTPTSGTAATPVFRWGFGLWSEKYKSVDEIPDGATISLYSDPANEAQGLWVLENAGRITLKPGTGKGSATQADIATDPKTLKFTLLDFAAQSRALPDLDDAVGYTEYYLAAIIPLDQLIFAPTAPDEFAGQLTIGSNFADTENIKKLVAAFKDPVVQEFLRTSPAVKGILLPL